MNGQIWFHFILMSNELAHPKFLACPSDASARVVRDLSTAPWMNPWDWFVGTAYRNNAVSYVLGLDVFFDFPSSSLVADRNLEVELFGVDCSSGVRNVAAINAWPLDPRLAWAMNIHRRTGNLLLADGRVEETSTARLRQVRALSLADNGLLHLLLPRYP